MQTGTSPEPMDLSTLVPTRAQRRGALAVLAVGGVAFAALVPFATHPLARAVEFVPAYESAMIVSYLMTAVLLLGQLEVNRSRPMALLALGFLFTALLALVHMLTFPGLFAPSGLLGGNAQTTAWLYMCWHALFPLFVAGYALATPAPLSRRFLPLGAAAVALLVLLLGLLATAGAGLLPAIMLGGGRGPAYPWFVTAVLLPGVAGLAAVACKRARSLLDQWLLVAMAAWVCDVALSVAVNGARFDLGFYAGRVYGLAASLVVLGALAIENIRVHTRLRGAFDEMVEARVREKLAADDASARVESERALRRALNQTRYLVENTPLAVIEWDGDFVIKLWNARAEELFGWSALEVLGRRIDSFPIIHQDDIGKVAAVMEKMQDPGTHYIQNENRNRTRDGGVIHAEWYNSVLHDEEGRIVTVFSLVLDVTERHQAMERLQDADRRKDVYIATLAHELRNPLAPIANAASLLHGGELTPDRIAWIADMVGRQTAQMSRLLDDLLDVSRIGRGKIRLRQASIDLRRVIRDALQSSNPLIEAGRHEVTLALPPEPVWVEGDGTRLTQVLANLLNNAAKYTGQGGRIGIALAGADGHATVTVTDNGVGIEPHMLGRVFEPFVQAGSAMHMAQGGLGIGLSLAKGLVELHGGTIAVSSGGPGCGSTFTVTLPLSAPAARGIEAPRAASHEPLRKSILVADDNADAADSLALLLRSVGAHVEVAHDGDEALRLFQEHPADIAVLDLGMPKLDGLEVAARLARAQPRPFLVALTGRGRKEDRAASFEAGFDAHLTKPVAPQQLIALLQKVRVGAPQ